MPASNKPASNQPDHDYVFRLPRSALRIASIAFGIGLLLFVIAWWMGRDQAFYKVAPATPGKPLSELEALPEPLAGSESASDMPSAGKEDAQEERPQMDAWAKAKGVDGIDDYWREKNQVSLDGFPTGLFETPG
jgi:hypothetical protein